MKNGGNCNGIEVYWNIYSDHNMLERTFAVASFVTYSKVPTSCQYGLFFIAFRSSSPAASPLRKVLPAPSSDARSYNLSYRGPPTSVQCVPPGSELHVLVMANTNSEKILRRSHVCNREHLFSFPFANSTTSSHSQKSASSPGKSICTLSCPCAQISTDLQHMP